MTREADFERAGEEVSVKGRRASPKVYQDWRSCNWHEYQRRTWFLSKHCDGIGCPEKPESLERAAGKSCTMKTGIAR